MFERRDHQKHPHPVQKIEEVEGISAAVHCSGTTHAKHVLTEIRGRAIWICPRFGYDSFSDIGSP